MTSTKEFIAYFLKYVGATLCWSNTILSFILWDLSNTEFRAILAFAIMHIVGKYLEKDIE